MRNYALATKAFSLGQEIRYIRKQEIRARNSARYHRSQQNTTEAMVYASGRHSLEQHRKKLSFMARATHLARGYLAGTPYRVIEQSTNSVTPLYNNPMMLDEICKCIARYQTNPFGLPYGYPSSLYSGDTKQAIKNWLIG